jgi:hypothetical protein
MRSKSSRKNTSSTAPVRVGPGEEAILRVIAKKEFLENTNPALLRRYKSKLAILGKTYNGLRSSFNRIRNHYKLPSSEEVRQSRKN